MLKRKLVDFLTKTFKMNNENLENKIIEYWHLSKTLFSNRYERLQQIKKWLLANDTELVRHLSNKKLWMYISEITEPYK
jgi:hypothetical protein